MFARLRNMLVLTLLVWAMPLHAETCQPEMLDLRGPWGQARFMVEVADTDASRAQGLMYRASLAASQGMLFVYPEPGAPAFWMKNTLIPLDMLFITPAGIVQHVHAMARPHDLTPISGGDNVQLVLEIRGGMAAMMGIEAGSELRHPAVEPSIAVWPCRQDD